MLLLVHFREEEQVSYDVLEEPGPGLCDQASDPLCCSILRAPIHPHSGTRAPGCPETLRRWLSGPSLHHRFPGPDHLDPAKPEQGHTRFPHAPFRAIYWGELPMY